MTELELFAFRPANAADAEAIAALHADSWRRHYRGAYSDAFLDGDVEADRRSVWTARLNQNGAGGRTIVATLNGAVVGFAHTMLDQDPTWGALLDNLHVCNSSQRLGVGTRLMQLSARAVVTERPDSGLYLWVLKQNVAGQAFYQSLGGRCVSQAEVQPPAGDRTRLTGTPIKLRYAWADPLEPSRTGRITMRPCATSIGDSNDSTHGC